MFTDLKKPKRKHIHFVFKKVFQGFVTRNQTPNFITRPGKGELFIRT